MNPANVQSIDALKEFRLALWKFAELAGRALMDAEGEIQRTQIWLETEQDSYWRGQIQRRTELVTRARNALLEKKLYKSTDGGRPSAVDEEKAFKLAVARLDEANQKMQSVRRFIRVLQREVLLYRGQVQPLSNALQQEIPTAAERLESLVASLEKYATGGEAELTAAAAWQAFEPPTPSMARAEPPAPPPEPSGDPARGDPAPPPLTDPGPSPDGGGNGHP